MTPNIPFMQPENGAAAFTGRGAFYRPAGIGRANGFGQTQSSLKNGIPVFQAALGARCGTLPRRLDTCIRHFSFRLNAALTAGRRIREADLRAAFVPLKPQCGSRCVYPNGCSAS